MTRVIRAVIPAAGLGTRFLPATKSIPKELLPIVDVPTIQLVVQEATASGLRDLVLVTSRGKSAVEDHFDVAYELEERLRQKGSRELLARVQAIAASVRVVAVRQQEPRGLGHAVLCARPVVGRDWFAAMLPDDLYDADPPALAQLLDAHRRTGKAAIALMEVSDADVPRYGIAAATPLGDGVWTITDMVEKPALRDAPSRLAIIGRYVLPPEVFDYIEATPPGAVGEIQLTDALRRVAREGPGVVGVVIRGTRHDAGERLGWIQANIAFALKRPELAAPLRAYMRKLLE